MTRRAADEGSLYQSPRDSGRWFAATNRRDADGQRLRRKRGPYATRRAAAGALSDLQREELSDLQLDLAAQSVGQFLDGWLRGGEHERRPRTQRAYRDMVRLHLTPQLGDLPLDRLRPQHVRALLAAMRADGLAASTADQARRVLHTAMAQAVTDRILDTNPVGAVRRPKATKRDYTVLDEQQARDLMAAAAGEPLEALIHVALGLGLRQAEVLGLRWGDVDYDNGLLHVTVQLQRYDRAWHLNELKGGVGRTLPLPPFVASALRRRRAVQLTERARHADLWNEDRGLVFTTAVGEPLHARAAWGFFKRCLRTAGLPDMRPHDERHSFATQMAQAGVPLVATSAFLGHANSATTREIYQHVRDDMKVHASEASQAAFGDEAPSGAP